MIDIATCPSGKRRYLDYTDAHRVLAKAKRRKKSNQRRPVRAYRCQECGGWHLSSIKERTA